LTIYATSIKRNIGKPFENLIRKGGNDCGQEKKKEEKGNERKRKK